MHFTTSSFFLFIPSYKWIYKMGSVKNHNQIPALGCLESVVNEKRRILVKKKTTRKNFFNS